MDKIAIRAPMTNDRFERVLSPGALAFVAELHLRFNPRRRALLERRAERQQVATRTGRLDFLDETREIREDTTWQVAPIVELDDRRVEITGPTDAKMLINALNSGAKVFMADFEDANSPTWANMIGGQANLIDAVDGSIRHTSDDGRTYRLVGEGATLMPRPRGWHLWEKHLELDGAPVAAAFVDFGLYLFHNAKSIISRGAHVYLYLPKLESHLEARLWNDIFIFAEDALSIPRGSIRATVLIETVPAAFEMDEILFELREHSYGLNAGRWDYLFSMIKTFRDCGEDYILPDRNSVTMTAPFMRAYAQRLVATCHGRGTFAMGGMSAYIPNRRDAVVNEAALARVREDKLREVSDGFDGTWVAHPDLVPVAMAVFDEALGHRRNQVRVSSPPLPAVDAGALLNVRHTGGAITEGGVHSNIAVSLRYLEAWLGGVGAVAIDNLMEDVATAEIARSQIWQWLRNRVLLSSGMDFDARFATNALDEEVAKLTQERQSRGEPVDALLRACEIFKEVALSNEFVDFLTLRAYQWL